MTKPDEYHVFLNVFGQDPATVTALMGISPTDAWAKGDMKPHAPRIAWQNSKWMLQSDLPITEPIAKHLDRLLPLLEERRDAVREIAAKFDAELSIAAYFYDCQPGFQLSHDHLRRISDLNLPIDFDLYCLATEEGEA